MSTTTQPPKPKRRWNQFSLRTLLVVVTVATLAFGGWVQYTRQQAQENRDRVAAVEEAVAEIEKLGGEVTSAYEELRPPTWLEEQFDDPGGADNPVGLLKVTGVNLYQSKVTDAGLEQLKGLTMLDALSLEETDITDVGLEHLKGMTGLHTLILTDTNVTDAGLEHLKGLTDLRSLDLMGTNVTAAGLEHLKGLTNLRQLALEGPQVTDAGLEQLEGLTKLDELHLFRTNVTDDGLKKLQQALPKLSIESMDTSGKRYQPQLP